MSEAKDPAIKLFGKTIPVPDISTGSGDSLEAKVSSFGEVHKNHASSIYCSNGEDEEEENEIEQDTMGEKPTEDRKEDVTQSSEEITNVDTGSRSDEASISPSTDKDATTWETSRTEEERGENSQEKTLKKPDQILPCPRCNSTDTKFCYFNNYNANQPRHFCKNCQRYWTAGGSMRNVPVGAGRRRNKNSTTLFRQITVPEAALQNPQSNGVHHPSLKCNGTVLSFGSDTRLCESMQSVLELADKTVNDCVRNGFNGPEEPRISVPYVSEEKGSNNSHKSSATSAKPTEGSTIDNAQEHVLQNFLGFPPHVPYFSGAPWPFPWNPAQWNSPVPPPNFFPPGFTIPFYPAAAYWGFTVPPGAWNMNIPWLAQPSSPNSTARATSSGPNSPTLGKHSREENTVKSNDAADGDEHCQGNNKEKNLWVPKTLRIDDLGEAEKCSMWTTLGIEINKVDSFPGGGLFKAFTSKRDEKNHVIQTSPVLQANPAALSRSINFHESS
ncbi:hypothetical protein Lal_00040262 [Lupinus albus]|uniref:Putative transcription factor C2C2-Dof family n=1 Tax=Lupinus albus TaxID=3870 RepID=A0A6A4R3Q9_LUPAL|nr:putative transcription factor C2C2-Dof family [Lupinus albus]KAF1877546.1 hypothetical protein Lal_00040262 [Lupinus albus]